MVIISRQQGLTLLELLLAVGLIAVISTMAFIGLNTLIEARARTQEKNTQLNQFNLTLQLLTQDIQLLHAIQPQRHRPLEGDVNRLTLKRLQYSQVSGLPSAVQRIKWEWRNDRLIRSTQDLLQPGYLDQWSDRVMLQLSEFSCRYEDSGGIDHGSWPVTAETADSIPQAVLCRFGFDEGQYFDYVITPLNRVQY